MTHSSIETELTLSPAVIKGLMKARHLPELEIVYNRSVRCIRNRLKTTLRMAGKQTFADDFTMREIAMDILKSCAGERDIILQVQRVMNSRIDTLSADMALQQLAALRTRCATSLKPKAG